MVYFSTLKRFAFTGTVTLFAAVGCVSADVVVDGGSPVQQKALHNVYDGFVPRAWQTHANVTVSILTDREMNAYIKDGEPPGASNSEGDNSIDGIFEDHPARITLRGSADPAQLPMTFAHEYGHYVWQEEMSPQDRTRYTDIYNRQKQAHLLVTDYSYSEVDEGFAEAVSFYLLDRSVLENKDTNSLKFLDDFLSRDTRNPHHS